jgi:hypothetical protein
VEPGCDLAFDAVIGSEAHVSLLQAKREDRAVAVSAAGICGTVESAIDVDQARGEFFAIVLSVEAV